MNINFVRKTNKKGLFLRSKRNDCGVKKRFKVLPSCTLIHIHSFHIHGKFICYTNVTVQVFTISSYLWSWLIILARKTSNWKCKLIYCATYLLFISWPFKTPTPPRCFTFIRPFVFIIKKIHSHFQQQQQQQQYWSVTLPQAAFRPKEGKPLGAKFFYVFLEHFWITTITHSCALLLVVIFLKYLLCILCNFYLTNVVLLIDLWTIRNLLSLHFMDTWDAISWNLDHKLNTI